MSIVVDDGDVAKRCLADQKSSKQMGNEFPLKVILWGALLCVASVVSTIPARTGGLAGVTVDQGQKLDGNSAR
jgi:hypothetical protein